jgi:CHAD domain-containing protein
MKGSVAIRDYAFEQIGNLLTSMAAEVHRSAKTPGADEIHDVRVSIRRFSQGMELFAAFFPKGEIKKIKKLLKRVMRLTSEIRNRDMTLEFLVDEKIEDHRKRVEKERKAYQREYAQMVRGLTGRDFAAKWRKGLSLGGV